MDEPADGPPPDAAAIRRALAECMTLRDIDDAMGWATGTARRRRWRDPDAGGLPPADAELGGVPLWFRPTINTWRAHPDAPPAPGRRARPRTGPRRADAGGTVRAAPEEEPAEADTAVDAEAEAGSGAATRGEAPDTAPAGPEPEPPPPPGAPPGAEDVSEPEPTAGSGTADGPPTPTRGAGPAETEESEPERAAPGEGRLDTGFALTVGQVVLAYVRGMWHHAVVVSRDRRTVVVDYQLAPGPLGARRQRVTLERILLPDAQPPEA